MFRATMRLLLAASLVGSFGAATAIAPVLAGGGCHAQPGVTHTEGDSTVVRMDLCSFGPTVVHVPVGTEVRFLNTANLQHMVVGEAQTWGSDEVLEPGDEVRNRFPDAGVFPYSCPLHPGMVGAVVVGGAQAGAAAPPAGAQPAGPGAGTAAQRVSDPASPTAGDGPASWAIGLGAAVAIAVVVLGLLLIRRRPGPSTPAPES